MTVLALALIGVVLVVYTLLTVIAVRRTREPLVAICLGLAAYWTMVGAIPVVISKWHSNDALYSYLEERLFPLRVDGRYLVTLTVYGVFLIGVALLVALTGRVTTRRRAAAEVDTYTDIGRRLNHGRLVLVVAGATVLRVVCIVGALGVRGASSLYEATRTVRGSAALLLRLYQYLNIVSIYPLACGLGLFLSLRRARPTDPVRRLLIGAGYAALSLFALAENALLGNRAVPLVALGAVFTLFLRLRLLPSRGAARRRLVRRTALAGFVGLLFIGTVGISRGGRLTTPGAVVGSLLGNVTRVGNVFVQEARSSEKLAAHMSLYGVLGHPEASPDPTLTASYPTYTALVDAPPDQVFTIHYVTAWWLRVGVLAPVVAALTFGGILSAGTWLVRPAGRGRLRAYAGVTAGSLWAIGLPVVVVRSGPEALRAVVVELVVLPSLVLAACSRRAPASPAAKASDHEDDGALTRAA